MIMTILPKQLFGDNDRMVKVLHRLSLSNEMAIDAKINRIFASKRYRYQRSTCNCGLPTIQACLPVLFSRLVNLLTKLRLRFFREIVTTKCLARPIVRFNRKPLDVSRLVTYTCYHVQRPRNEHLGNLATCDFPERYWDFRKRAETRLRERSRQGVGVGHGGQEGHSGI